MRFSEINDKVNSILIFEAANPFVKSSWIEKLWWEQTEFEDDDDDSTIEDPLGDMHMKVKNNPTDYVWEDVPKSVYTKWRRSRSKGKYFHKRIKNFF